MSTISLDRPATVETLSERIAVLVGERQQLRASAATDGQLEENRREIARLQQLLSAALIARHSRSAA